MKQVIMDIIEKIRRRVLIWRIERALGIELFDWQIAKIFDDTPFPDYIQRGRYVGKTTAQILFVLLSPKLRKPTLYGFPPRLYVDNILNHQNGFDVNRESARIAYFFGEDGVCLQRRALFIKRMQTIATQLHAAKIKTNRIAYVYHNRTHHI